VGYNRRTIVREERGGERMRLHIIAPCRGEDIWRKRRSTFTLPPMALGILAALTPPDVEVRVTDELVEDIDFGWAADAVALSVNTTSAPRSYEVAGRFRERGARVIMGGIHPSVLPGEAGEHADVVVRGEAEARWAEVVEDLRRDSLKPVYECGHPKPEDIPAPQWDLINGKRYFTPQTFQVSRGCPYGCSFCSSTSFFGTKYRFQDVGRVVDEVRRYPKRFLVFVDDNIVGSRAYARELFGALRPLGKRWVAQSSVDIAKDGELLELARKSGCAGFLIGLESVSYGNRGDVRKLRRAEEYEEMIARIRGAGIGVHGSFVFGFDGDGPEVFHETVDFVMRNRLEVANYCKLTPFPGTRLYEEMEKEGRITERDWSKYDRYNIVYRPKNVSVAELKRGADEAYRRTYGPMSILRRLPGRLRNIPYYLAINGSYWLGARRRR
jgi:radical SAM superfamily enzyme YgiQ (UPF0313 family)